MGANASTVKVEVSAGRTAPPFTMVKARHTWTVDNIQELQSVMAVGECVYGKRFEAKDNMGAAHSFRLSLYPKGWRKEGVVSLGVLAGEAGWRMGQVRVWMKGPLGLPSDIKVLKLGPGYVTPRPKEGKQAGFICGVTGWKGDTWFHGLAHADGSLDIGVEFVMVKDEEIARSKGGEKKKEEKPKEEKKEKVEEKAKKLEDKPKKDAEEPKKESLKSKEDLFKPDQ